MSRATLWRLTSSSPGSSDVRITDWSSLSGFASGSTRPRVASWSRRRRRTASGEMKLKLTASLSPRPRR